MRDLFFLSYAFQDNYLVVAIGFVNANFGPVFEKFLGADKVIDVFADCKISAGLCQNIAAWAYMWTQIRQGRFD